VKYSIRLNNDTTPDELLSIARAAEANGFHQLWVSDDLLLRAGPVLVASIAPFTTSLELGIAVMNPYSAHVSEIAMMAATLQEVTHGRFLLGLGAGSAAFLSSVGLSRERPLATTRHAIMALRHMLGHDDVGLPDPPEPLRFPIPRPVPVYLGAMGPKMLAMAGEVADGALPLLYPPEYFRVVRAQVTAALERHSRSLDSFDLPACFWVSVSDDGAAGRFALASKLAYYGE
jgi:5,10-methylenetetrahydromethanopterin reductase